MGDGVGDGAGGVVAVDSWRLCIDIGACCRALVDCASLDVHVLGLAAKFTIPRLVCLLTALLAAMEGIARGNERKQAAVVDREEKRAAMLVMLMEVRCDACGRWSSCFSSSKLEEHRRSGAPAKPQPISALPHVRSPDLTLLSPSLLVMITRALHTRRAYKLLKPCVYQNTTWHWKEALRLAFLRGNLRKLGTP